MPRATPPVPTPLQAPPVRPSASDEFIPDTRAISSLRAAAAECAGCELFRRATHVVFGEGPADARLMLVGEQPGDHEDLLGRPFVGPAGALLARVLKRVGIPRESLYVTNAVKHFKWEARGQRRLHVKPSAGEVQACRGWLMAEIEAVRPALIVALGATAAQTFFGRGFSVTQRRGEVHDTAWAPWWMATWHPSALLRMPEPAKAEASAQFEADLRLAADALARAATARAS